jgi:hypothetical protein
MTSNGHTGGFAGAMVVAPQVGPSLAKTEQAFEPRSINEAMHLAGLLVASRLLPRSVATPEAAFAIIATGRELGLTAMQSLRTIHVIEGKPTLSADLIAALCKSRRDVCQFFMLVESTDKVARYKTQRVGEPQPTTMSYTIEDAQRAGLVGKDNWRKHPAAMLRARCITALARAVYPDLASGIYDPDEIGDTPMAPPQAYEPMAEQPAAPVSQVDEATFEALAHGVDEAETAGQLNVLARSAQKAHRAGKIHDGHLATIAAAVKKKRAAIDGPPPKAPPSAPGVDPSGYSSDEADFEAQATGGDQ